MILVEIANDTGKSKLTPAILRTMATRIEQKIEDSDSIFRKEIDFSGDCNVQLSIGDSSFGVDTFIKHHPDLAKALKDNPKIDHDHSRLITLNIRIEFDDFEDDDHRVRHMYKTSAFKLASEINDVLREKRTGITTILYSIPSKTVVKNGVLTAQIVIGTRFMEYKHHKEGLEQAHDEAITAKVAKLTTEAVQSLVKHGCVDTITKMDDSSQVVFRGMAQSGPVVVKEVRADRAPSDTSVKIHRAVDKWFNDTFGVKYRSEAVFASRDKTFASEYGRTYVVIPSGTTVKCVYSDSVQDLFQRLDDVPEDTWTKGFTKSFMEDLEYEQVPFESFIKAQHTVEVMIDCDKYVAIDYKLWKAAGNEIIKQVKERATK